jgi:uracil-DNA glycosylase
MGHNAAELEQAIRSCRSCDLSKWGGKPVLRHFVENVSLFVVGIAPTQVAEHLGEPFTGDVGRKVSSWLASLGLDSNDLYFTNAIKCVVRDSRGTFCFPLSGVVSPWAEKCRPWLLEEISVIHPKIIILLGVTPLYSLTGYGSISRYQREKQGDQFHGISCFALNHPSSDIKISAWENSSPVQQVANRLRALLRTSS